MKLHANAALSLNKRRLLCRRVVDDSSRGIRRRGDGRREQRMRARRRQPRRLQRLTIVRELLTATSGQFGHDPG
jgi:hypothetical protein